MLTITVPSSEDFNEDTQEFVYFNGATITLEHSLVSLSKWEAKWKVPFLNDGKGKAKTPEQILDYIKCMTLTQNVPSAVYSHLTTQNLQDIKNYIEDPATATTITHYKNSTAKPKAKREVVTSELIYYWMIALQIPMECQKWNLNRLMTLIQVCNIKESGESNKMSKKDLYSNHRSAMAAARRRR